MKNNYARVERKDVHVHIHLDDKLLAILHKVLELDPAALEQLSAKIGAADREIKEFDQKPSPQ